MITFTSSRARIRGLRDPRCSASCASGRGRRDQRSSHALAQAAAPAEGGGGAEQGQGAGGCCCRCCRGLNDHLDRLTGASQGPSADQACCGEANASQGLTVKCGAANSWSICGVSRSIMNSPPAPPPKAVNIPETLEAKIEAVPLKVLGPEMSKAGMSDPGSVPVQITAIGATIAPSNPPQ